MKSPVPLDTGLRMKSSATRLLVNWVHPARIAGNASAVIRPFTQPICASTAIIIASLALSACSSAPIVGPPVYIPTKVYLAIPAELTLPVTVDLTGMTYGEGLGSLREGLERCDGQLAAIRVLTPPRPPHK